MLDVLAGDEFHVFRPCDPVGRLTMWANGVRWNVRHIGIVRSLAGAQYLEGLVASRILTGDDSLHLEGPAGSRTSSVYQGEASQNALPSHASTGF